MSTTNLVLTRIGFGCIFVGEGGDKEGGDRLLRPGWAAEPSEKLINYN